MFFSASFRSFGTQCEIEDDDSPPLLQQQPKQPKKKGAPEVRRPVSKFVLTSEKKAKVFTGLDKEDRNALWNLLGDSKDKLQIIGLEKENTKSGDLTSLSVMCQFLLVGFPMLIKSSMQLDETSLICILCRKF